MKRKDKLAIIVFAMFTVTLWVGLVSGQTCNSLPLTLIRSMIARFSTGTVSILVDTQKSEHPVRLDLAIRSYRMV